MTYAKILQFAMVAFRAVVSTLDPKSPAAVLGSKALDLIEVAVKFSGLAPSPMMATMPSNAFKGMELPPQPWTPADLLKWAETQQFATPVAPVAPTKASPKSQQP